ncbi:hypothetical protein EH5_03924 [Bacillus subtilis]|nr:hypothetical protein EH5_03924 [Bacillus subtilis]
MVQIMFMKFVTSKTYIYSKMILDKQTVYYNMTKPQISI